MLSFNTTSTPYKQCQGPGRRVQWRSAHLQDSSTPPLASIQLTNPAKTEMIPINSQLHYYTTEHKIISKPQPLLNTTSHPHHRSIAPLLILIDPNLRRLELPRRNFSLKENIRLTIRPMLQLRQSKVRPNPHHQRRAPPDIPALAGQVPSRSIKHPGRQINHRNFSDIVRGPSDSCTQRAESHRRCLGDDGVRDRTLCAGVHHGDDHAETGLCVVRLVGLWYGGDNSEDEEEGDVRGGAVEEDGASTEPGGEDPGDGVGDELETGGDEVQLEGFVGGDTGLYIHNDNVRESSTLGKIGMWEGTHARRSKWPGSQSSYPQSSATHR